jgi:hypothetical protein
MAALVLMAKKLINGQQLAPHPREVFVCSVPTGRSLRQLAALPKPGRIEVRDDEAAPSAKAYRPPANRASGDLTFAAPPGLQQNRQPSPTLRA